MISQNSEPMETSMKQSPHPSAMQISSENAEPEQQRKTKVEYVESQPDNNKPTSVPDDVPEEEFKLSPRQ